MDIALQRIINCIDNGETILDLSNFEFKELPNNLNYKFNYI